MLYPLGVMSVGDIFSRAFSLLFSRFALFYAIMAIVELPMLALQLALPDLMIGGIGPLVLLLPTTILQAIGTGALIRVVMQQYLDRPVHFGEAIRFALSRLGALLGTAILSGLLVFVGMLACIIPGIYFGIAFSLASQAVIIEDRAGMDALNRSKSLVAGYFGRVWGILFVIGLCVFAASGAVSLMGAEVLPYQSIDRFRTVHLTSYPNYALNMVLNTLIQVVFQTFTAICTTLIYFDLRNRKEGFDLELEADKISAWTEHFQPRPHSTSSDIQQADAGIQPPASTTERSETGIRPAAPEVLPPNAEPSL